MQETIQTAQLLLVIERIRAGDETAREELLSGVCRRMERLARGMLRGFPKVKRWVQTDDVLQSALMRLLRSLKEIRISSTREFFGMAAVQVRRELLDLARHFVGPRNPTTQTIVADDNSPLERASPLDDLDLPGWTRFHEAVERLPTEEREVVSLVFYHQWTQAEVAELFQVHVRTVRRWWQAALARLRRAVRDPDSGVS